ncbi:hypothetical protein ACOMHN_016078 [Nucella lapillus]
MEIKRGVCSCFVTFATTFLATTLLLLTPLAQAQRSGPTFVSQPDAEYYINKRIPVDITCEALGATAISFTCIDSVVPAESQRTLESYDEASGKTLVKSTIQVTRVDVYNYQRSQGGAGAVYWCYCVAEDIVSRQTERSSRAIVRLAFMRKRFEEEPASLTAKLGSRAVFRCVAPEGQPTPEVLWRKDERRLSVDSDDNYVIGADNSLTLVTVRRQDAGNYQCVAKNKAFRRMSSPAVLTIEKGGDEEEEVEEEEEEEVVVEEDGMMMQTTTARAVQQLRDGDEPIFLEEPPETVYVGSKKSFLIVCDAQGTNRMTVLCNRQRVPQDRLSRTEDRVLKRIRIVYNLTYADVENYINRFNEKDYRCECVAWYRTPKVERGWASMNSNSSYIQLATLEEDFEEEPPRNVTVQLGTTATLPCKPPMGKPNPWVYWVFNEQRVDPRSNPRYRIDGEGSLVVQQVQDSDQGQYYCVAQNIAGSEESRVAYLTVSAQPVPEPLVPDTPVFTVDLESVYYLDGEGEANLVCSVIGAGRLIYRCSKGRLDGDEQVISEQVSPDGQAKMFTGRAKVSYNDIVNTQVDDYTCTCKAWYYVDGDWKTAQSSNAIIKLPYLDAEFRYEPKGGVFAVGDSAELACQPPEGGPEPMMYWLKDGRQLNVETDSNLLMLDGGVLAIESVRLQDAGQYVCFVNNSAGERSSAPVAVEVYELDTTTTTPPIITTTTTAAAPTHSTSSEPSSSPFSYSTSTLFTTTPYYPGDGETTEAGMGVGMGMRQPLFTLMPEEKVFILRGVPVKLMCSAMQVSSLQFFCNGQRVFADDEVPGGSVDPTPGLSFLEKSIQVTREDVESFEGPEPYTCQCRAYFETEEGQEGQEDFLATDTILEVAFMRKRFEQSPVGKTAAAGERTELVCRPPRGVPKPVVYWLKDGFRLENSDNVQVISDGSLVFKRIEPSDAGDYTCAAENIVTTRFSETITVRR